MAAGQRARTRGRQCRLAGSLGSPRGPGEHRARRRLVQAIRSRGELRAARARLSRLGGRTHRTDQARPDDPLPVVVHLVDGTYELFRHFYGLRRFKKQDPPLGAVAGVLHTVLELIEKGGTHVGVATDHVIESFRNGLWRGYKTSEGMEPALLAQFHPLEDALAAMGVTVWPMVELEADDALAAAAHIASADARVEKVCIWTPDKDLAQCVRGERVVQMDRKANKMRDEAAVRDKYGVEPRRIPDLLALVGDSADGYPGIAGIGDVTAARLINRHGAIEDSRRKYSEGNGASWRCSSSGSRR